MNISEKLVKPVMETEYLTVENAAGYRAIIRLFYLQYEKMKCWLYRDEVHESLAEPESIRITCGNRLFGDWKKNAASFRSWPE